MDEEFFPNLDRFKICPYLAKRVGYRPLVSWEVDPVVSERILGKKSAPKGSVVGTHRSGVYQ